MLFLILPTRCLTTVHIRNQANFQSILEAIGFSLVEPVHNTPHLTFFVLRARPEWSLVMNSCQMQQKKKKKLEAIPFWQRVIRQYFRTLTDTSPDSLMPLTPYRSTQNIEEVSETEDFSVLFAKEYFGDSL